MRACRRGSHQSLGAGTVAMLEKRKFKSFCFSEELERMDERERERSLCSLRVHLVPLIRSRVVSMRSPSLFAR